MNKTSAYTVMMLGVVSIVAALGIIAANPGPSSDEPPRADPVTFTPVWEPPEPVSEPIIPPVDERITPDLTPPEATTEPQEEPEPERTFAEDPGSPRHISIPAISVDHPVINVGLLSNGSMEIPHDVDELGWYEPGIKPGELGSAVIAGHVDSASQGRGAFFDLRLLETGDNIEITDDESVVREWVVTDIARFDKNEIPMDDIFRWEGESEDLVLVTCGGEFDRTRRSYNDNIVVYASPIS